MTTLHRFAGRPSIQQKITWSRKTTIPTNMHIGKIVICEATL